LVLAAMSFAALPLVSQEPDAIPATTPVTSVVITVNTLANRHPISPYVYGANFPPNASYVTQSGATMVRWGGNNSSRYNWKINAKNIDADWYFENYSWGTPDSPTFLSTMAAAGGSPLMTIPMLGWVAKDTTSVSFSVKKYGKQCDVDPYRSDAGNGVLTNCSTDLTGNDPTDANTHLLDAPSASDPVGSVYRNQWIAAIAAKFGSQPHFYDLDNEPDIWGGTHRDVHPAPTGYDELAEAIVKEGHAVKSYDPLAVRFAPVFCCWWFYWNGANNNDKNEHGGQDFLPWLLNEIRFNDIALGTRSLDVFDVHAYFNGPSTSGLTKAQIQAAALRETRDWWDASYVSESGTVNQPWATQLQPSKTIAFVIPRMRALANTIYPGTPVSFTEWNGAMAGESDFSTALADADAYGILGRERMYAASRWTAADAATPAYKALLLYRNADAKHHGFQTVSVAATSNASANLFSVFASIDPAGSTMTLMVVNKSPTNADSVTFDLAGFQPSTMTTYALTSAKPTTIVASASKSWTATQSFPPYSATLIVATGATPEKPAVEWDLNPDTLAAPASSSITITPQITSVATTGGTFKLTSATGSAGLTFALTQPKLAVGSNGLVTIKTPSAPGLYKFTLTGADSANVIQSKQGWVLVGNPAATLTKTGDNQTAPRGKTLTLTANFLPGSSGVSAGNVSILFTTSAGKISSHVVRTSPGGQATVTLTLPTVAEKVSVTAQTPIPVGGEAVVFTETAQ
jgi:hypothetical protein